MKTDAPHRPAVEAALRKLCEKEGLMFQSYADLVGLIDTMMARPVASLWVLLVMGLVVAAFGIVNTLTMNVLEQTRGLGQLRIVGMTRRQVRRTIFAQASMMGLLAILPGILAGVALTWLINLSTAPVTGHPVEFFFRPWLIVGATSAALAIVLISALAPAARAARLSLTAAMRCE